MTEKHKQVKISPVSSRAIRVEGMVDVDLERQASPSPSKNSLARLSTATSKFRPLGRKAWIACFFCGLVMIAVSFCAMVLIGRGFQSIRLQSTRGAGG